jgi:hypothetical protein
MSLAQETADASSLPDELLLAIFGHTACGDSASMLNVLLACRRFCTIGVPILYSFPVLSHWDNICHFVRSTQANPSLANHALTLSMIFTIAPVHRTRDVDTFVRGMDWPELPNCIELSVKGVGRLDFLGDVWFGHTMIWASKLHRLRTLRLAQCMWNLKESWLDSHFISTGPMERVLAPDIPMAKLQVSLNEFEMNIDKGLYRNLTLLRLASGKSSLFTAAALDALHLDFESICSSRGIRFEISSSSIDWDDIVDGGSIYGTG